MALFAKLDSNNKVIKVDSVEDKELLLDGVENEQKGIDFLNNLFKTNDVWVQTFKDPSRRKNYAGIGHTYDKDKDAFIPINAFSSWTLNEDTCRWEAPVAYPDDGKLYLWNETILNWKVVE